MLDLTPDTRAKMTLGGVVVGAFILVGFGWKAQATLSAILVDLKETKGQIVDVADKMNARMSTFETIISDRFTKAMASEWSLRMQVANPTLRIPDPRDPAMFLNSGHEPGPHSDSFAIHGE